MQYSTHSVLGVPKLCFLQMFNVLQGYNVGYMQLSFADAKFKAL